MKENFHIRSLGVVSYWMVTVIFWWVLDSKHIASLKLKEIFGTGGGGTSRREIFAMGYFAAGLFHMQF